MPTFSADQIIGKSLVAIKRVPIFDLPAYDTKATRIGIIEPGQTVGVVYSYVGGTPGKFLNWQFYDQNKKAYYAPQAPGYYDVKALQDQGTLTTKELEEKKEEENKSPFDKILDTLKKGGKVILFAGVGLVALNVLLKNRNK
jgi:hypothetical protein